MMADECNKRHIKIVFYTCCPYEGEFVFEEAMKDYALEKNCTYINLFENLDETGISG